MTGPAAQAPAFRRGVVQYIDKIIATTSEDAMKNAVNRVLAEADECRKQNERREAERALSPWVGEPMPIQHSDSSAYGQRYLMERLRENDLRKRLYRRT